MDVVVVGERGDVLASGADIDLQVSPAKTCLPASGREDEATTHGETLKYEKIR
jgi:hypothetical protein